MICEAPIKVGPNQGKPATGTPAGFARHRAKGEAPCPECLEGNREAQRIKYLRKHRPERKARRITDKAGSDCGICGRPTSEHRVGEWCRPIGVEAL